jgi:hypothetical protein
LKVGKLPRSRVDPILSGITINILALDRTHILEQVSYL